MAKPRSLIEQAVLDCFDDTVSPRRIDDETVHLAVRAIRGAMAKQLKEEAVQRDHRRRREARDLCAGLEGTVVVDANAQIAHDVEYDGCKGAWVTASVFVRDSAVEDE